DDIEALHSRMQSTRAAFLNEAVRRYRLKKEDFLAVIDGMEMDVIEDMRAPDFATFDLYCDRVASAVGRVLVKGFGRDESPGLELARHLGRALQFTNVLRDLDEDASVSRLYLPREFLADAGISDRSPKNVIANPAVDKACRVLATLAHEHY